MKATPTLLEEYIGIVLELKTILEKEHNQVRIESELHLNVN